MNASFAQLVHTLSYGDAISGEVLALDACFASLGAASGVYAINVHPRLKGKAKPLSEFPADFPGELVLHYSLGSPLNSVYASASRATRTLLYHNLTPAHWFSGVNPRVARDIENGLAELPALLGRSHRVLADSRFNASELAALGFDAEVLELPVDPSRWSGAMNEGLAALIRSEPGIHLLHVGRMAPNKRIEDIIRAFYFLHHHLEPQSKLWLVGIDIDTELYSYSLKRMVHELRLDHAVQFVGCLSDEELRAMYSACTVYLCMSEHEGFCLPVIEAMHFGLPVVAYASSALPDTVADGGILVREKRAPEIAELVLRIANDTGLREALIAAGKRRASQLSYEAFCKRVEAVFRERPEVGVPLVGQGEARRA